MFPASHPSESSTSPPVGEPSPNSSESPYSWAPSWATVSVPGSSRSSSIVAAWVAAVSPRGTESNVRFPARYASASPFRELPRVPERTYGLSGRTSARCRTGGPRSVIRPSPSTTGHTYHTQPRATGPGLRTDRTFRAPREAFAAVRAGENVQSRNPFVFTRPGYIEILATAVGGEEQTVYTRGHEPATVEQGDGPDLPDSPGGDDLPVVGGFRGGPVVPPVGRGSIRQATQR